MEMFVIMDEEDCQNQLKEQNGEKLSEEEEKLDWWVYFEERSIDYSGRLTSAE